MKLTKQMTTKGGNYALIEGMTGKTVLDDICKTYSQAYKLTSFPFSGGEGTILLKERTKELKNPVKSWYTWETGKK